MTVIGSFGYPIGLGRRRLRHARIYGSPFTKYVFSYSDKFKDFNQRRIKAVGPNGGSGKDTEFSDQGGWSTSKYENLLNLFNGSLTRWMRWLGRCLCWSASRFYP